MDKSANNEYPIQETVKERWSPRAFSDEPVPEEDLRSLFEAARWAPSSYNEQPWHFIVGTKSGSRETYDALFDCLLGGNQTWAKTAPVLALSVARKQFVRNGQRNRHALHDVGLAVGNLLVEATARDLYVHQMAGFEAETARENFAIPESQEPVAGFAIGYRGDPESLPADLRDQERADRSRKTLDEFVFSGEWGSSAGILRGEDE